LQAQADIKQQIATAILHELNQIKRVLMLDIVDRILPGLVKDGIDMKQSNNKLDS
jgi:hypothetical protein